MHHLVATHLSLMPRVTQRVVLALVAVVLVAEHLRAKFAVVSLLQRFVVENMVNLNTTITTFADRLMVSIEIDIGKWRVDALPFCAGACACARTSD